MVYRRSGGFYSIILNLLDFVILVVPENAVQYILGTSVPGNTKGLLVIFGAFRGKPYSVQEVYGVRDEIQIGYLLNI